MPPANNSKLSRFFFRNTSDWKYWLIVAFFTKALLFVFQLSLHRLSLIHGFWGATGGDTGSYLIPINNLISKGSYSPDYRMPGYGTLYLVLVSVFSVATACNIIIILQLAVASVSVYVLALTAKLLLKKDAFFYACFYVYALSYFSNSYDIFLYTESLTTSFIIFSVFYFVSYFKQYHKTKLLLSGIFLTWVIFLRPVFCLLPIFFLFLLAVNLYRNKIKILLPVFIFLVPFVLCDGAWVIRNYIQHKKVLPLSTTIYYPESKNSYITPLKNFVHAWGGEYFWYYSSFLVNERKDSIPAYIYTSQFNRDSLGIVNGLIEKTITDTGLTQAMRDTYLIAAGEKLRLYTASIKHEKPMLYYVKAPLILLDKFLIHSGNSYALFNSPVSKLSTTRFIINLLYYAFYLFIIGLGCLGIIMLCGSFFRASLLLLVPAIPLYTIFIHVMVFRECDTRYLVPAYSFLVICAIYAVWKIYMRLYPSE